MFRLHKNMCLIPVTCKQMKILPLKRQLNVARIFQTRQ